jgi:hypothetical protein
MVDWTILTPAFLLSMVEWVVTIVALGARAAPESRHTCHSHPPRRRL